MARMNGLSDSLTIGILLILIFGAVSFYLFSKISQLEKKMSLLENLLISLKMSTEASLSGPDSVEAISGPQPIEEGDLDTNEDEYTELLRSIPAAEAVEAVEAVEEAEAKADVEEETTPVITQKIDVNYEGMNVKELQGLARSRCIVNIPGRKKELIELLKSDLPGAEESEGPSDL